MNGREIEAMRGKVLGGSSSINVMVYTRGNRGDYDRWAQKGALGWSYADVLPYFKRCETWEGGANPWRGGAGPVGTEFAKSADPLYDAWLEAAKAAGFPVTDDYNGAQQEGFGRGQYTIRDGRRSSAATPISKPAMKRPNLDVVTGALATRVLMQGTRATGVEYVQGIRGTVRVNADREVILSAGAFNSPQLLMLSGIGPADHLREIGIKPVVDLPVGKNLQDHLAVMIFFERKNESVFRHDMRFDRMAVACSAPTSSYRPRHGGPGRAACLRQDAARARGARRRIHVSRRAADAHLWFPRIRTGVFRRLWHCPTLLHPDSRGEILLRSSDPREAPRIVFNFFCAPNDMPRLRRVQARARGRLSSADGRLSWPRDLAGRRVKTDAEIDAFIRRTAITAHHPCGTCAMGRRRTRVTDPELRVRGIDACAWSTRR